ncbi:MAG: hypothetical protein U0575_00325 [Phycisphaerales bacterium]
MAAIIALAAASAASAQLRIANYNVAHLLGDSLALQDVFSAFAADDKPGFATAPAIIALDEVRAVDRPIIEALVASAIPGATYITATYTTSAGEDAASGAEMLLYRSGVLSEVVADHLDLATGAGRKADRWHLKLVGYDSPLASVWIYGAHLKAGSTPSDAAERLSGAQLLRDNADLLPAGAHVIFCGDFNIAANSEATYTEFLLPGAGQAVDPLGTGSWAGGANAIKQTQSPRDISADGLTGGGMDDRFDFQLGSTELNDGNGLSLMPGTYRALGNDGQHFNNAINLGNNTYYPGDIARSNALADDLFDASDHLPVLADYRVPAVMGAAIVEDFGRVLQGASFGVPVYIANIAVVVTPDGVDALDYTVAGGNALSGSFAGSVGAAPDLDTVAVPLDTGVVGFAEGYAIVTASSEATQYPQYLLFTSGLVLRHANASLVADDDVDVAELTFDIAADTGVQTLDIPVYNAFFDENQALLDVDAVAGFEPRFALQPPLPGGIGGAPGIVQVGFDTTGATGVYAVALTITCSDEDLPGAASSVIGALVTVNVAPVGNPADLNHDGVVNGADLGQMLGSWGACPGCPADLNHDGVVDGADLGALLGAWG